MNSVDVALKQLLDAIRGSSQYREYMEQLQRVKQYPELKEQIDAFRKRNFELQNSGDYEFDSIEQFENEYAEFRENEIVSDFLAAELAFCRLMQDINLRLTAALEFE
jgi:cell fate (sporulation/competence/biofilm development) regulator YlbF (YheA/YmcA/DUF963 family)